MPPMAFPNTAPTAGSAPHPAPALKSATTTSLKISFNADYYNTDLALFEKELRNQLLQIGVTTSSLAMVAITLHPGSIQAHINGDRDAVNAIAISDPNNLNVLGHAMMAIFRDSSGPPGPPPTPAPSEADDPEGDADDEEAELHRLLNSSSTQVKVREAECFKVEDWPTHAQLKRASR